MKRVLVITLMVFLLILSCSKASYESSEYESVSKTAGIPDMAEVNDRSIRDGDITGDSAGSSPIRERKRIMNAHMEMTVDDIISTEKELTRRTLDSGGWIVSSRQYWGEITLTVKIPAENFESFISSIETIGEVDSKSITTDDVTEAFYDLKSRIENKIILRDRFRAYLEKAESMEDILSVERQLNDVTTEIEQLEGAFRGLNRDIDYSTITFILRSVFVEDPSNKFPSFKNAFSSLKYVLATFFYYLFFVILYLIIFGIPVILAIGLLYVLGWGKIGLVRRFFGKLKK